MPNFCTALKAPDILLLDPFTKIKLKKQCLQTVFVPDLFEKRQKKTGCYYFIPPSWADSINYDRLSHSGLIITTTRDEMCPLLTYKNFEQVTLKGKQFIDNVLWKTLQINHIKRLLKKNQITAPESAPDFVLPITKLEILVYKVNDFFIPLIQKSSPLT